MTSSLAAPTSRVYTSSQLRSLNHLGLVIPRRTRKELFRLRLWRPACDRVVPAPSRPTAFFAKFASLLETFATYNSLLVVTGDLNIHLEDTGCSHTVRFGDQMRQFGLIQHVAEPTHKMGGWLDVVITRDDCTVSDLRVEPPFLSDHGLLLFNTPHLHAQPTYTIRSIRGWRNLDREAFNAALLNGPLCRDVAEMAGRSSEELFSIYEQTARALIDNLLSLRSVRSCRRPLSPWMDREYRDLRREVRCLERRFRRTCSDQDRAAWTRRVRHMYAVLREKEMRYWENLIEQDAGKPCRLWASLSAILGRSTTRKCSTEPSFTATSYLDFMNQKIEAVRRSTESAPPPTFHQTDHRMPDLQPFSMDVLRQLMLS